MMGTLARIIRVSTKQTLETKTMIRLITILTSILGFANFVTATVCPQGDNLCTFEEFINVYFIAGACDGVELALDDFQITELEAAFLETYDLLTSTVYCDSLLYRDIADVEAHVGGWNPSCAPQGGIVIPPEDEYVPIQFRVSGTYCEAGPCGLEEVLSIYDLPGLDPTSMMFTDVPENCFCDSFIGVCRSPYEYEFVNAFRETVESKGLGCFKSVGECNFDTIFSTSLEATFQGNVENVTVDDIEEVLFESLNEVYESNEVTCNAEFHTFESVQAQDNVTLPSYEAEFMIDFDVIGICNGCAHELDIRDDTTQRRLANNPAACGASVAVEYEVTSSKCFCSPDIPILDWSDNEKLVEVYGEITYSEGQDSAGGGDGQEPDDGGETDTSEGEDTGAIIGESFKTGVEAREKRDRTDIKRKTNEKFAIKGYKFNLTEVTEISNDFCEGAIGPLHVGDLVKGSTVGATPDNMTQIPCGSENPSNAPGVWYTVEGTGDVIAATTCTSDPSLNNGKFDSQISVFEGNCGSLKCLAGNNNDIQPGCSLEAGVSWVSEMDTTYYLLVFGYGFLNEVGDFGLEIKFVTQQPLSGSVIWNDECYGATPLQVDDIVEGTTEGATADIIDEFPCADEDESDSPGVWFSVVGTGEVRVCRMYGYVFVVEAFCVTPALCQMSLHDRN